ncbi:MAG: hypothetical protein JO316_01890 [Abitibacteriaceae bacterium]|nr:hypothetical protein [Abditibacteriaceae bacterium]MBV9864078.1 hypothetical protein [Abditibacteriaceae bacterium]
MQRTPGIANNTAHGWTAIGSQRQRLGQARHLWFAVYTLVVIAYMAHMPVTISGDAQEYLVITQAWFDHASPDMRPEDISPINRILRPHDVYHDLAITNPYLGFFQAHNGRWYCWHFWLYPLCSVPFKALFHVLGADEFYAFKFGNIALFLIACYMVVFQSALSEAKRWMVLGLAGISPVIWYLNWAHPESFSWSFVLLSLVCMSNRNYWQAALCAALPAMQNPPLLFLAGYMVLLSWRERHWSTTFVTGAGAALGLLPIVFYKVLFGSSNLIMRAGLSSVRFISWSRFWGFFFDLNQGLLPYVPGLLALSLVAVAYTIRQRNWKALYLGLLLFPIILSAAMTHDWISAMAGLMRYAIWMLPIFAWFAIEALPDTPQLRWAVAAAVILQGLILTTGDGSRDTLTVKWPARLVWNYAAAQYNPPYIIFAQRVAGTYGPATAALPIGYTAPTGNVTKILTDTRSLSQLTLKYRHVDAVWLAQVQQEYAGRKGEFYIHPPAGAVAGPVLPYVPK